MRSHRIEIALYWRWYSIYFTVISLFRKIFEVLKTKITSYQTFRRPSWFQQRKSCVRIILTILQSEYQQIFSYRSFAKSLSLHKKMKFSIKEFFSKCDQVLVLEIYNFTKKRRQHTCFSVNFAKFLRTPFPDDRFCHLTKIFL